MSVIHTGSVNEPVIKLDRVCKSYKLYNSPSDRLKESLHPLKRQYHQPHYALDNISLEINKGETIGLIGVNGSGKSTLLKIITGVLTPSSGQVTVRGKVSALLELGAGFNPEYTGLENIYLNGTIMGYTKEQMDARLDQILSFADIGDFIYQPVKLYSSGMFARLAFAVSINVDPEILIVDEALSVGDMVFQAKCMKKIKSLMDSGCTTLFVSHDTAAVKSLCTSVVYLEQGKVKQIGPSGEVCEKYIYDQMKSSGYMPQEQSEDLTRDQDKSTVDVQDLQHMQLTNDAIERFEKQAAPFRKGTGEAKIIHAVILDPKQHEATEANFGEQLTVRVFFQAYTQVTELVVAIYIKDKNQIDVLGNNSQYESINIENLSNGTIGAIDFSFTNHLLAGNYSLTVLLADSLTTTKYYDWVDNAYIFRALDEPLKKRWALVNIPMEASIVLMNKELYIDASADG